VLSDSPFTKAFSVELTRMEAEGKISMLRNIWWKYKDVNDEKCPKVILLIE